MEILNVIIREAEPEDVGRIAQLEPLCFEDPWSEDMIYDDVARNSISIYLVAEIKGVIQGYVGVWLVGDECQINNVAVAPEYRRMGIGRNLMGVLIGSFTEKGVEVFTLEVRRSNIGAISMYESLGFKVDGVRPGYYENNGEDAILMSRGNEAL